MQLEEILSVKRPSGDVRTYEWAHTNLSPVFGEPDEHGNYYLFLDKNERYPYADTKVAFTAHYDTVHKTFGKQKIFEDPLRKEWFTKNSECLGADCGSGIWLILEMIASGVPGHYFIFADEEIGCVGSSAWLKSPENQNTIDEIDIMISFDRFGKNSIITHQSMLRTASDEFADSLAKTLSKTGEFEPDKGGIFTDSNTFEGVISECTNLSVGYNNQHSHKETQDIEFLFNLRDVLISPETKWNSLIVARDPEVCEYDESWNHYGQYGQYGQYGDFRSKFDDDEYDMLVQLCEKEPERVAAFLWENHMTVWDIFESEEKAA